MDYETLKRGEALAREIESLECRLNRVKTLLPIHPYNVEIGSTAPIGFLRLKKDIPIPSDVQISMCKAADEILQQYLDEYTSGLAAKIELKKKELEAL